MSDWRESLNRLTVEFWYGLGDMAEIRPWADAANEEMGEVHPRIWDIYAAVKPQTVTALLFAMAKDLNGFVPDSWEAIPHAVSTLKKALARFLARELSVQAFCKLVSALDTRYVSVAVDAVPDSVRSSGLPTSWLGELWNCCDWCDETWTYDNSQLLAEEARRVLELLANLSFLRTTSGGR